MRNGVVPRALLSATLLGGALVPLTMLIADPASATPACVPTGYTATSTADLLKLDLLDLHPLGFAAAPLARVVIGHATADMARAQPNTAIATADYLNAQLAGITVSPSLLTQVQQIAPPSHLTPEARSLVVLQSPQLGLGVGTISASAGQAGPLSCARAHGSVSIVDASILGGTQDRSLVSLPTNLNSSADVAFGSHASTATASTGLARLDLFNGTQSAMGVRVLTEPTLTGIASSTPASSSVTYQAPVLDVTLPDGSHTTLDSAHADMSVTVSAGAVASLLGSLPLPALPISTRLAVRLSLGSLTKNITSTSVSGSATTLRLQVLASIGTGERSVLDVSIGALAVTATVPATTVVTPPIHCDVYGTGCAPASPCPQAVISSTPHCAPPSPSSSASTPTAPAPSPSTSSSSPTAAPSSPSSPGSPSPSTSPSPTSTGPTVPASPSPSSTVLGTTSGNLPLTGTNTAYVLGAGMILLIAGWFTVVVTRRRMSSGRA